MIDKRPSPHRFSGFARFLESLQQKGEGRETTPCSACLAFIFPAETMITMLHVS